MHVDLGKGRTAEIIEPDEMPHRVRVAVEMLAPAWIPGATDEENHRRYTPAVITRMRDTMMAHVVTEWSLGEAPGGDPDRIGDLPEPAYDKLVEETEDHWVVLGFSRRPKDQEKSTSEPSSSSE